MDVLSHLIVFLLPSPSLSKSPFKPFYFFKTEALREEVT